MVTDPDHDISNEQDKISVDISASSGDTVKLELAETLAHSGVFTGSVKPEFAGEKVNGKAPAPNKADEILGVDFGDEVTFTYNDSMTLSGQPAKVAVKGSVYPGSDAEMANFSKLFKDPEMAVKTNFLMAEALFEMGKEHRKLKQLDISKNEIDRGKRILEEAMRDYPNTTLVAQGEFLLANLAQELESYQEAIGRYAHVINTWPESEYAARSQFKKAICLEKMEQYEQACEEYVKLTYVYPDNILVADATVRMGNYYYKKEAYKVSGQIFQKFQHRNPTHQLAPKALFLAAQSYYKMKDYREAIKLFSTIVSEYTEQRDVREEAMYWLGDSHFNNKDMAKAYQTFKKLTWDYPEGRWAKIARGRLTEEAFSRIEEEK
jgi:TolA-binding protein